MRAVERHEDGLRHTAESALRELPGVRVHSRATRCTFTLLATFAGRDPQTVRQFLADRGINAPAGTFDAYEPARHLGLGDTGGLRIGLAPYNNAEDVLRLTAALAELLVV